MKDITFPTALLAAGVVLFSSSVHADTDSVMQQRFREENRQLDLTGFLQADNDARSDTFQFGSVHTHEFTIDTAGTYRFTSQVPGGYINDYSISAVLKSVQGNIIAQAEGFGASGGLDLDQQLEPGDYRLEVEATRFGSRGRAGDGYYVTISGLDEQGNPVDGYVSDGDGVQFIGTGSDGNSNAFVRSEDTVVTLGSKSSTSSTATAGSAASATSGAAAGTAGATAASSSGAVVTAGTAAVASSNDSSDDVVHAEPTPAVQTVTTDVAMRTDGDVLTFEVTEPSQVHITTSTYPTGQEDKYRNYVEVRNESGNVVAEGSGEGYNGNVDMTAQLAPGRYRISVRTQTYGPSRELPNNYSLEVKMAE